MSRSIVVLVAVLWTATVSSTLTTLGQPVGARLCDRLLDTFDDCSCSEYDRENLRCNVPASCEEGDGSCKDNTIRVKTKKKGDVVISDGYRLRRDDPMRKQRAEELAYLLKQLGCLSSISRSNLMFMRAECPRRGIYRGTKGKLYSITGGDKIITVVRGAKCDIYINPFRSSSTGLKLVIKGRTGLIMHFCFSPISCAPYKLQPTGRDTVIASYFNQRKSLAAKFANIKDSVEITAGFCPNVRKLKGIAHVNSNPPQFVPINFKSANIVLKLSVYNGPEQLSVKLVDLNFEEMSDIFHGR